MGTYNRWFISCSAEGELLKEIKKTRTQYDDNWACFCYGWWSDSTKWSPHDTIKVLSKKYPEVIFCIWCRGESAGQTYYFAGNEYDERVVFPHPTFPPTERFADIIREAEEEAEREKIMAERERQYAASMELQANYCAE